MCAFVSKKITKKNDLKNRLGSPEANFSTLGKNVSTPEVLKNLF